VRAVRLFKNRPRRKNFVDKESLGKLRGARKPRRLPHENHGYPRVDRTFGGFEMKRKSSGALRVKALLKLSAQKSTGGLNMSITVGLTDQRSGKASNHQGREELNLKGLSTERATCPVRQLGTKNWKSGLRTEG